MVHKDLKIKNIKGLKGLNSCHTGVARNVGYKIPITKLSKMGVIGNLADPELSPRENELNALSKLFNKACIVGKWSEDPEVNSKLSKFSKFILFYCTNNYFCFQRKNIPVYVHCVKIQISVTILISSLDMKVLFSVWLTTVVKWLGQKLFLSGNSLG